MYELLTKCPLFRGLAAAQVQEIIDKRGDYVVTDYAQGACIAERDTAYSGLMIILKGRIVGCLTDTAGKTQVVDTVEAPQLIAPAFLFGGYNKLPLDIIAQEEVTILTLHRGYLFELMQDHVLILSNFIDIVSNRASVWSRKIYFLSLRSLQEKLAAYLLEQPSEEVELTLERLSTLAVTFDVTRSALQAALDAWQRKGIISFEGGSLRLLNRAALQEIVPLHA